MSALETYTFKRFSRLKKQLRKYSSEEDAEILHGIRVEIKKIKVILQLVNKYVRGFQAHRNFVPLREIFRKAGEIRQPQVFYDLLLRYEIQGLPDSWVPGSQAQSNLSKRFKREIPAYVSIAGTSRRKLEKFLGEISNKQIKKYVKDRKEALRRMLQGQLSGMALHKSRKVIKEILYLEAVVRKSSKREPYLHQLEELIGQWHDRQLLVDVLRKGKSAELARLESERNRAMKKIRKSISKFYRRND